MPGRVKTRLTPPFTPEEAAALAEAALARHPATPCAPRPPGRRVLVLDGAPGPWLPAGFEVVPQCAGGLDERLAAAFAGCAGPALLIGMDTPQVTPELLAPRGLRAWDVRRLVRPGRGRRVLGAGPGRTRSRAAARRADVHARDRRRAARAGSSAAGLRVRDLPPLRDVDTADDAERSRPRPRDGRFAARRWPGCARSPADEHRPAADGTARATARPWRADPYADALRSRPRPALPAPRRRLAAAAGGGALVRRRRTRPTWTVLAAARAPSSTSAAGPAGWSPRSPRRAGRRSASTSARPRWPAPPRPAAARCAARSSSRCPARAAGAPPCSSTATSASAATRAPCSPGSPNSSPPGAC